MVGIHYMYKYKCQNTIYIINIYFYDYKVKITYKVAFLNMKYLGINDAYVIFLFKIWNSSIIYKIIYNFIKSFQFIFVFIGFKNKT